MSTLRSSAIALATFVLSSAAIAQEADWRLPIHTQPGAEGPSATNYGIWTSGASFKASFHDGFSFYPRTGSRYPNLPIRWKTTDVTIGHESMIASAPASASHSDWRFEIQRGNVVEVYEVRKDSIEQLFVVSHRPAAGGDLVVRGAVTTDLVAAPTPLAHSEIVFSHSDGTPLVSYGAATAIDANGRKWPMQSSFDGKSIELRLGAMAVAQAQFPLTVDPIVGSRTIATERGDNKQVFQTGIARDNEARRYCVTWQRQFSQTDSDVYAALLTDTLQFDRPIFADISTARQMRNCRPAFNGARDRWVIVCQYEVGSGQHKAWFLNVYIHDRSELRPNWGRTLVHYVSGTGWRLENPQIGGTGSNVSGDKVLIVFEKKHGSAGRTNVMGLLVDAKELAFSGTEFQLGTALSVNRRWPHVTQESGGGDNSWLVVWSERSVTNTDDDWDIWGHRVKPSGRFGAAQRLAPNTSAVKHRMGPVVGGQKGRFLVGYGLGAYSNLTAAREIGTTRVSWLDSRISPTLGTTRSFAKTTTTTLPKGMAYDHESEAYWGIVYQTGPTASSQVRVARLGHSGGVVEDVKVGGGSTVKATATSIAFNANRSEFAMPWTNANNKTTNPILVSRFGHENVTRMSTYGTGCDGSIWARNVYAGHEFFEVTLTVHSRLSRGMPALLLVGSRSANIDLTGAGLPGCRMNVLPIFSIPHVVSTGILSRVSIPMPDAPAFKGSLRFQFAYMDPTRRAPVKFATTKGLLCNFRP